MNDLSADRGTPKPADVEAFKQLRDLVDKARVAMLTTVSTEGELRARPLHTLQIDEDGSFWFVVGTASPKAQEVRHESHVCLAYSNISDQEYVSVSGQAHIVKDQARKKALWNKMIDIWFPGGDDGDEVSLLKVVPESAEYWDGPSNAVTQIYAFTKAIATGKTDAFGENAKLSF